jgi:outer membrane protein assembly factor BamB
VVAIDLAAKKIKWTYKDETRQFPFYSSAAFANGTIVIGGRDKFVHGIDSGTGRARWTLQTRARVESSPLISGSAAWVGSNDGRLYAINVTTGRKLWEWEAGGPLSASPALADGVLVIGTQDGQVFGLGK